ncbi:MAG: hypothetical protein LBD55_01185 [Treponema sp.]|jgi:citrate lyase subunit alpha/citrate CoA-transferase|nr:hypothetical protein [Treponema sp.]
MKDELKYIKGLQDIKAMNGVFEAGKLQKDYSTLAQREVSHNKIVPSLEEAVRLCGLKNGRTISFHHHFRDGDYIVNMVLDKLAEMGFKDLVLAASSLRACSKSLNRQIIISA